MKKLKKMTALLLSFAMVLAMAVTANAAGTEVDGNLKITLKAEETGTTTATVYQVLENDQTTGAWKLTDWAKTALGNKAEDALAAFTDTDKSDSNEIAGYLTTLAAADKTGAVTATATSTAGTTELVVGTTALGSYLVILTSSNFNYTNMLVSNYDNTKNNGLGIGTATAKGVKKDIIDEKTADDYEVKVGDVISYTVKGEIPDFRGTGTPSLVITDTMGTNVEFKTAAATIADTDVTVKVNGTQIADTNYDVAALTTGNGFTVTFTEDYLKTNAVSIANKKFELTYQVEVTGYNTDNTYTNTVTGSANINGAEKEDPGKTVDVYTAALKLIKQDATDPTKKLANAEFVLSVEGQGYVAIADDGVVTFVAEKTDAKTFTSGVNGEVVIEGLDPDFEYTIEETKAPQGYTKLANATVTFTRGSDENANKYTVTVTGDTGWAVPEGAVASEMPTVNVNDTRMGALPSTGGVGIIVVSFIGVALMLAFGGVFLSLRKKTR